MLTNTKKDLQKLINGFSFAPEKCKVLALHTAAKHISPIFLGPSKLEHVQSYKYLGIIFETAHQNYKTYLDSVLQKIISNNSNSSNNGPKAVLESTLGLESTTSSSTAMTTTQTI